MKMVHVGQDPQCLNYIRDFSLNKTKQTKTNKKKGGWWVQPIHHVCQGNFCGHIFLAATYFFVCKDHISILTILKKKKQKQKLKIREMHLIYLFYFRNIGTNF